MKTLSDKITLFSLGPRGELTELFRPHDVKEFIKELKEDECNFWESLCGLSKKEMIALITKRITLIKNNVSKLDELAGDKLI